MRFLIIAIIVAAAAAGVGVLIFFENQSDTGSDDRVTPFVRAEIASMPAPRSAVLEPDSESNDSVREELSGDDQSSGKQSEGLRIIDSPLGRRIEALPSVPGFSVRMMQSPDEHPAAMLAMEAEDPVWSGDMEGRILQQVAGSNLSVGLIHTECRSTMCGLVLAGTGVAVTLKNNRFDFKLGERLGFEAGALLTAKRSDGTEFAVIYMMPRRVPQTGD